MTRRAKQGFTLVEVVVSVAVLSLIMLATVSGLRTLGNTAGTLDQMTARIDEIRSVSAFLRDALENAVVGSRDASPGGISFGGDTQDTEPTAYFRKIEGSLEWRSKVLFGEAYGGNYFLRLARVGERLVLQWQEPDGGFEPGDWLGQPSRNILDGVELFEIWHRSGLEEAWSREDYDDIENPPGHIKLVIRANGRFWPELVMAVQR